MIAHYAIDGFIVVGLLVAGWCVGSLMRNELEPVPLNIAIGLLALMGGLTALALLGRFVNYITGF